MAFPRRLTDEVEVAFSAQAVSEESNHLMKLHAAVDDRCHRCHGTHIGVHLLVHQPEGQSFIPDQSLERSIQVRCGEAAQKTSIKDVPLDRDSLHRRCISPRSACWSACRRCCPCPSPRPLTPSGSTVTERAYWKHMWSMRNRKIRLCSDW